MCNQIASDFFVYNKLLTNLSTPIKFVETNNTQKNVFLIGNIGNGKSTLGNKLMHLLRNNLEPPQTGNLEMVFPAGKSPSSIT